MLPKQNRLKKKKDCDSVIKQGRHNADRFLVLKIQRNSLEQSRIGFVVSKKISKKAVERNRIKRRLREIVKKEISELKNGIDLVFLVKKNIITAEFSEIEYSVKSLLKKSGLYV